MKRVLSLLILLSMIVGAVTIPAYAKSSSKTKSINMYLEGEGRGAEVICSVPYYSKWKTSEKVVYGNDTEFITSDGMTVIAEILNANEDDIAGIFCKYLAKKKYKNKLFSYLSTIFKVDEKDAATYFTLKKDGNGKYLLVINTVNEYGVVRALDGEHVLTYFTRTEEPVSKSLQKKLISYTKQTSLEKKNAGTNEPEPDDDLEVEILDVKLDADKVIFSQVYSNMAWQYQKRAVFILGDGRIYSYDFAKDSGKIGGDLSEENVIEYLKGTEPAAILDKDYLMKMYSYAVHIDPNAKYTTVHEMYDYGQKNFYFHTEDGTKIKFASYGDVRYIFEDKYATKLEKLFEEFYIFCK